VQNGPLHNAVLCLASRATRGLKTSKCIDMHEPIYVQGISCGGCLWKNLGVLLWPASKITTGAVFPEWCRYVRGVLLTAGEEDVVAKTTTAGSALVLFCTRHLNGSPTTTTTAHIGHSRYPRHAIIICSRCSHSTETRLDIASSDAVQNRQDSTTCPNPFILLRCQHVHFLPVWNRSYPPLVLVLDRPKSSSFPDPS